MKREIVNLCLNHRHPHEECPPDCGHAISYFARIEKVKRIIARELLEEQKTAAKLERAAVKVVVPVFKCQLCDGEFHGQKRKFCSKQCREANRKELAGSKIKERWQPHEKQCRLCSKPFTLKHPASKFCSDKCKRVVASLRSNRDYEPVNNPPIPCKFCNTVFQRATNLQIFCSKECRGKAEWQRNKKVLPVYSHCSYCRKPTNHHRMYCDDQCSDKEGRRRERLKKKAVVPPTEISVVCCVCQSTFQTIHPTKKFCGKKCKRKDFQKKKRAREKGKPKSNHVRIKNRLSGRLRELLRREGKQKTNAISAYMGCTPKEMLAHVDKQLEGTAMNWSNYGVFGWHLDHIIPCSYFDLLNEEHLMVCFNWRNIRPLWGKDNQERQDNVSLLDALEIPPELFEMATKIGVKLWV